MSNSAVGRAAKAQRQMPLAVRLKDVPALKVSSINLALVQDTGLLLGPVGSQFLVSLWC